MISPLRRMHRFGWIVLAIALPVVAAAALLVSPAATEVVAGNASLPSRAGGDALEGCWGDLPVRLYTSPAASPSSDHGMERFAVEHRSGQNETGSEPSTTATFSNGTTMRLEDNDLVFLRPAGTRITRLEIVAAPAGPSLMAYEVFGIANPGDGLANGARLLGPANSMGVTVDIDDSENAGERTLALYSLALDRTVGAIHLSPSAIEMSTCP
jgi:hypothetical protein